MTPLTAQATSPALYRHFLPVDRATPLDADGFLDLPSDDGWWVEPEAQPRPVAELIDRPGSFVLLAAGGAGKTTVLNTLRQREPEAIQIDLRTLDRGGMRAELTAAIEADGPIYLDALDEAVLYEPAVFRVLQRILTGPLARRVRWRLACRPAAWNPALASTLADELSGFEELRLLPLTRATAGELAAAAGADPEPFLSALCQARLGRLAATPLQLGAVARRWASTGDLPTNQIEAFEFEVRGLLGEVDGGRPKPSLSADRQRCLAGRLGAIAAFCGAARFATAPTAAPGIVSVADLVSTPEPDEPGRPAEPSHYAEVLGTALFDAAPDATVSFRHQQYAEYLAAAYLVDRGISRAQLPALLGVHVDVLLPGAMIGTAAWLVAIAPERTGGLVADNALGLVKAGVDLPSDEVRATVVDGLLSRAAAGDIDPVWGLDLTGLAYPALDKQLAGHLNGGLNQPAQLWWISRLAVAGGCTTLAPALLKIVVVNAWPAWARTAGIDAVAELDDNESLAQLRPLLHLNAVEDPDDEVLAHTIKALHPRLLGTDDLVNALRPRRKTNLFGSYLLLLGDLPRRLPPEELPAMLSWAASHVHGGSEDYGQLLPQLVQRGWNDVDSVAVRAPLAALIASLAKDHSWHNWSRNGPPWSNGEVDRRRQLLIDVAERLDATGWYPLLNLRLVVADDASWLLDQLPALPAAAHAALAACVPHLLEEPSAAVADTILALPVDHPAYGPTNRLRQPLGIDSETANTWRKHRAAGDEGNISDARREERLAQLSAAIDDADQDPTRWWHVVSWLSVDDHGYPESEVLFSLNLTSRPGWLLLDDRQRTGLIDIGLRYLATHELEPSTWSGHKDISVPKALPDWAGLYLLTTLTRYNPERVRELEAAIWDRWSPAIVGAWDYSREDDANLRCELIDLAPSCGRRSVLNAGLDHLDDLQNHKRYLTPQKLYAHLAPDLAPTIADHLVAGRYNGQLGAELLDLLVKHTPQIALQACHQLRNGPDPELAARARRSLPSLDPAHTVDEFASGATADDLIEVVPSLNLAALDAARLAVLARLLLDWLPFAEDPSTPSLDWGADAESETRATRSIALQRLAELGLVSTLDQLAEGRPEADRKVIAWYRQIARSRAADLAYAFPSPKELLDLLAKGDARLVRHNADLLTVVIEQLRELQHEVTHNGAFRDLWNFGVSGDGRPKSEDDISDWIRRQLEQRLGHGTVVDREIQVMRRKPQGIGTRIDLTATSPTATHPPNSARIIVEAKLVNNRTLMTAMEDQLVRQYLLPADLQHGIYLVYWIAPERRPANSKYTGPSNRDELMRQLSAQAADAKRAGLHIEPFLLDITPPSVI